LALGAQVTVFDSKAPEELPKPELVEEAQALGLSVNFGWSGELDSFEIAGTASPFTAIVVNPAVDPRSSVFQGLKTYGAPIWSEVEFAYRIADAPILGITGTNGKSTTTVLTYLALEATGAAPVLCGNLFGSGYPEMTLTDAALKSNPDQVLVAEISSFQLEQISNFRPAVAAITNISPDHQDRYDRYEDYVAAKQRIFENQEPTDFAVIPSEDFEGGLGVTAPENCHVLRFGWDSGDAHVDGENLVLLGSKYPVGQLPFAGTRHNVVNALTAALLTSGYWGWKSGEVLPRLDAFSGMASFKGLAHRMEWVGQRNGVTVINNSMCTNPDAVVHSSQSVTTHQHLLIGGVNKGLDFAPLADYLHHSGHVAYLFGRDRQQIADQLGQGQLFETMAEAFLAATVVAQKGETIMLAPGCASTDQFRDFRDRGDVFRRIAQAWLEGLQSKS
jgi:UDP-N-acetylmuramoylalanine--D-glutamate ligase